MLFRGRRDRDGKCIVTLDNKPLNPRLDLRKHCPTRFDWSHCGAGASQLALAMLAAVTDTATALKHYQQFKWDYVKWFPRNSLWTLESSVILNWLRHREHQK